MQTRRASRLSALAVVAVALLALSATSPVTSAAKCYPKSKTTSPVSPPAADVTEASIFEETAPTTAPATGDSFGTSPVTDEGSFTTEAPTTQSGSLRSSEDSSSAAQTPTFESNEVAQGSSSVAESSADGSTAAAPSTPSTSSGDHATFGDITSASGKCVIGNPTTVVTREDVDWVWKNTMEEYIPQFKNLIFDQLVTNNGSLSYCVRWDNDQKLTKAVASKFQAMIEKQINLWNRWLVGYDCWPIEKIDITVVGFAVRDKSIMDWSDNSLGTIYEGILDAEGSPQCPTECYKHQGQAASADTSGCKGKPFDMSLWPSTKPGEGAIGTGGDWGQRVEVNDMLSTMDQDEMMVLLHEMGHGFGLPEMYVAKNKPSGYPACVMDESFTLTDGDGWLVRSLLENIKSRYDF